MPFYCDDKFTDEQRRLLPNEELLKTDILFCQAMVLRLQNAMKDAMFGNPSTYNALLWVQEYWMGKRDASRRLLREMMITNDKEWAWWEYNNALPSYGTPLKGKG